MKTNLDLESFAMISQQYSEARDVTVDQTRVSAAAVVCPFCPRVARATQVNSKCFAKDMPTYGEEHHLKCILRSTCIALADSWAYKMSVQ